MCQQIPNIPWAYCDVLCIPIFVHSLVLLGIKWRMEGALGHPPPAIANYDTLEAPEYHIRKQTGKMSTCGHA